MIRLGIYNILRRGNRSFLTALSIAIGVCSVVLISSLGNAGSSMITGELEQLGLDGAIVSADSKLTTYRLQEEDLTALRGVNGVESASGVNVETGLLRMRGLVSQAVVWGIESGEKHAMSITLLHGRMLSEADLVQGARVCVIDAGTAEQFYSRTNIVGKIWAREFLGLRQEYPGGGGVQPGPQLTQSIAESYMPSFVYMPLSTLGNAVGKTGYSQISIKMDEGNPTSMMSLIRAAELSSGYVGVFQAQNLSEQNERLGGVLSIVQVSLTVIAAISLVVATLGTMTIMTTAVRERTREIGIKKSIGATNARVMGEFLAEAGILSLCGAILGSIIAWVLLGVTSIVSGYSIVPSGITTAVTITVVLGTLFGVYPARLAAKMNPIDALRTE